MPSGAKKRKAAKKKKELGIQLHSEEGNGGRDDDPTVTSPNGTETEGFEDSGDSPLSGIDDKAIKGSENGFVGEMNQNTEKEVVVVSEELIPSISTAFDSESKDVYAGFVLSATGLNGDSPGGYGSSGSGSEEDSRSIKSQSMRESGKLVDGDLVTVPIVDPFKQVVSPSESMSQPIENQSEREFEKVVESDLVTARTVDPLKQVVSPSEEVSQTIENQLERGLEKLVEGDIVTAPKVDPLKQVVSPSEEVSPATESPPVKDSKLLDAIDFPTDGNKEKILPFPGDDPRDGCESHEESDNSASLQNRMAPALTPARPGSWMSCCGLFELLKGSHA